MNLDFIMVIGIMGVVISPLGGAIMIDVFGFEKFNVVIITFIPMMIFTIMLFYPLFVKTDDGEKKLG